MSNVNDLPTELQSYDPVSDCKIELKEVLEVFMNTNNDIDNATYII